MTYDELTRRIAVDNDISHAAAKRLVDSVFDRIKDEALLRNGRVNIPKFGVFLRRSSKGGVRVIAGVERVVKAHQRVIFRAATAAKR